MEIKNHQEIGRDLQLFFFDEVSPGSCFFLPHGTIIYNRLIDYIRALYKECGYHEINTPVMCHQSLWEKSGHWDKYRENMFLLQKERYSENQDNSNEIFSEQKVYSLCGMGCPKGCIVFEHINPSYRQLPLRLADFSPLHRNELHGALRGLTRVKLFHQDDAHIFCQANRI